MNFIYKIIFVLISCILFNPLFSTGISLDHHSLLYPLRFELRIGDENAAFFENSTSQSLKVNKKTRIDESLGLLYDHASSLGYPIILNQNGKVLFESSRENGRLLFLYDIKSKNLKQIKNFEHVSYMTSYALNNKDQVLYFKYGVLPILSLLSKDGKESTLLDPQKLPKNDQKTYNNALFSYNSRPQILFNDLGQVLLTERKYIHWLLEPQIINIDFVKEGYTKAEKDGYQMLGMNNKGDIYFQDGLFTRQFGVFHSKSNSTEKQFSFPANKAVAGGLLINNQGDSVFLDSQGQTAFFLSADHKVKEIPKLGGNFIYPLQINEAGQVIGYSQLEYGPIRGFLYEKDGNLQDIGTLGGQRSVALGINNKGDIVGFAETQEGKMHAFIKNGQSMIDLGLYFEDTSIAFQINDKGWVIGVYKNQEGLFQGFLYHADKGLIDIADGIVKKGKLQYNVPIQFNEKGQVIGVLCELEEMQIMDFDGNPLRAITVKKQFAFVMDPENGKASRLPEWNSESRDGWH